jgi:nucleotide-binding universal stress UspA family protein
MPVTSSRGPLAAPVDPMLVGPVVVGFDGSPAADRALKLVARTLAPDEKLLVVVVDPDVRSHGLLSESLLQPGIDVDALLDVARGRLAEGATSPQVETIRRTGDPGNTLVEIAREQRARLIAVGGRGHDFEARVLLGSTAAYVAQHAHCDVLVVR